MIRVQLNRPKDKFLFLNSEENVPINVIATPRTNDIQKQNLETPTGWKETPNTKITMSATSSSIKLGISAFEEMHQKIDDYPLDTPLGKRKRAIHHTKTKPNEFSKLIFIYSY